MSVLYFDGFESYDTAQIADRWDVAGSWAIGVGTGRNGGRCLTIEGATGHTATRDLGDPYSHVIVGFAFLWDGLADLTASESFRIFRVMNDATPLVSCEYGYDLGFVVRSQSGEILAERVGVLARNTWYYVEIDMPLSATTTSNGQRIARLNGYADVLAPFPGNKQWTNLLHEITAIQFGSDSFDKSVTIKIDDLYVLNGAVSPKNAMLGVCRAQTVRPIGSGSSGDFTALDGVNYTMVDDDVTDEDATYVKSDAALSTGDPPLRDTYTMADLSGDPPSVFAVQVATRARVEVGGVKTLGNSIRVGSANFDSDNTLALTPEYAALVSLYAINPSTGLAWTKTEVNGAEAGFIDTP